MTTIYCDVCWPIITFDLHWVQLNVTAWITVVCKFWRSNRQMHMYVYEFIHLTFPWNHITSNWVKFKHVSFCTEAYYKTILCSKLISPVMFFFLRTIHLLTWSKTKIIWEGWNKWVCTPICDTWKPKKPRYYWTDVSYTSCELIFVSSCMNNWILSPFAYSYIFASTARPAARIRKQLHEPLQ